MEPFRHTISLTISFLINKNQNQMQWKFHNFIKFPINLCNRSFICVYLLIMSKIHSFITEMKVFKEELNNGQWQRKPNQNDILKRLVNKRKIHWKMRMCRCVNKWDLPEEKEMPIQSSKSKPNKSEWMLSNVQMKKKQKKEKTATKNIQVTITSHHITSYRSAIVRILNKLHQIEFYIKIFYPCLLCIHTHKLYVNQINIITHWQKRLRITSSRTIPFFRSHLPIANFE